MSGIEIWLFGYSLVLPLIIGFWLLSLRLENAGIVDTFWGLGFIVFAAVGYAYGGGHPERKLIVLLLVLIWGLRIFLHLAQRTFGFSEERRFRELRQKIGPGFWWKSLFTPFIAQTVVISIVALPLFVSQGSGNQYPLGSLDILASILILSGTAIEAISDWQLRRFSSEANAETGVLRQGLWRYSRHPNYFGEMMVWVGFWIFALSVGHGIVAMLSPLVLGLFIVKFTGIQHMEKEITTRRPGYASYRQQTSSFLPLPPYNS